MPKPKQKAKKMNVVFRLDEQTHKMLSEIAVALDRDRSGVIRAWIREEHGKLFKK